MRVLAGLLIVLTVALVACEFGQAGALEGPRRWTRKLEKNADVTYKIKFQAKSPAEFCIMGDGSTDVDIFVYDEKGKLIAADTGFSDLGFVRWVPQVTQTYTIKVSNLEAAENVVGMGHN